MSIRRRRKSTKKDSTQLKSIVDDTVASPTKKIKRIVPIVRPKPIEKVEDVMTPIEYNYAGVDRVNSTPQFTKKLRKGILEDLIGKYAMFSPKQLEMESANNDVPIIERIIMEQLVASLDVSTTIGFQNAKYIQERIGGKVKDVVEHSGIDGSAIKMEHGRIKDEVDEFISDMSDDELEEYEKIMTARANFQDKIEKRKEIIDEQ